MTIMTCECSQGRRHCQQKIDGTLRTIQELQHFRGMRLRIDSPTVANIARHFKHTAASESDASFSLHPVSSPGWMCFDFPDRQFCHLRDMLGLQPGTQGGEIQQ